MHKSLTEDGYLRQPQSVSDRDYALGMKKEGVRDTLAANLRALMKSQGLSQPRLAAKSASGVPQVTLSRILRKENAATIDSVEMLAAYFKLDPWMMLLPGLDPKEPPELRPLTAEERALYAKLQTAAADIAALQTRESLTQN